MNGFVIIGLLVGLMGLYITYYYYKRNDLNNLELVLLCIFWLGFIIIDISAMVFVEQIKTFLEILSVPRLMDLFTIIGFISLYIVSFGNYTNLRRMQKDFESIVREDALRILSERITK